MLDGEQKRKVHSLWNRRERALALGGHDRKAAVEVGDENLLEEAVSLLIARDTVDPQLLREATLDRAEGALAAAASLWRASPDVGDAQSAQGTRQLAGWSAPPIFEGGASPLIRRIPKRGFHNAFAKTIVSVNVGDLSEAFRAGEEVTIEALRKKDLVSGRFDQVKILGDGELTKKLKISAHRYSATAKAKIEEAGGEAIVLSFEPKEEKPEAKTKAKDAKKKKKE